MGDYLIFSGCKQKKYGHIFRALKDYKKNLDLWKQQK